LRRLAPIAAALGAVDGAGAAALLIQKVDSRGRGAIARDVSTLLSLLGHQPLAVVCPAFPAQGRYFRDGATSDAATGAADVDLAGAFRDQGYSIRLGCGTTQSEIAAEIRAAKASNAGVLLCDGRTPAQMRAVAAAVAAIAEEGAFPILAVASAGLTTALAGLAAAPLPTAPPPPAASMAFVLGTAAEPTRRQAAALTRARGVPILTRTLGEWREGAPAPIGGDVIWALAPPPADAPLHSSAASAMAESLLPQLRGARPVLLSGGDTARAVLTGLGLDRFEVLGAIEPGLCHGRSLDFALSFFTKSGGFGDEATLIRLYDLLRNEDARP
jgi:uncharacterized protein YgbK (DUF1537 family)